MDFTYISESVWYQNPFVHIATKNTLCIGIGMEESGEIENRSPLPLFGYYYVHTYYRIPLMWLSIHPWLNNGFDDYSHLFYCTIGQKLFWILNSICKLFFYGTFSIFFKTEVRNNFSWNHKILASILLSKALGLLVLDKRKPNDIFSIENWEKDRIMELVHTTYLAWKLKPSLAHLKALGPRQNLLLFFAMQPLH